MSSIETNLKKGNNDINEARRQQTEKKQFELKKIDEEAKRQEADMKAASESTKREIRASGDKQILDSMEDKERRLTEMKKSLDDTSTIIAGEKVNIQKNMEDQRGERLVQFNSRMDDLHSRHRENVVNANEKLTTELAELNERAANQEKMARYKGKVDGDKIRRDNDSVVGIEEKRFQDQIFNQDIRNNLALVSQQDMFKNTFNTSEGTHNQKFMTQQIRHNHAAETAIKQNEMTINQSKADFEVKYKTFLDEQQMMMENLNHRIAVNTDKMKNAETESKKVITERAEDKFYSGISLNPIVIDEATAYKIKIPLAPHEAASANLSGKDRNLKFVFSRNSENNIKMEDGSQNKTKKSESVVKEFSVAEIINERKIEKSYKDGFLVFHVPKK